MPAGENIAMHSYASSFCTIFAGSLYLGTKRLAETLWLGWGSNCSTTYVNMNEPVRGGTRPHLVCRWRSRIREAFPRAVVSLPIFAPRGSIRRVPSYVSFIPSYLANQIARCSHFPCASNITSTDIAPRVDAQASSDRTGIGGWLRRSHRHRLIGSVTRSGT